MIALKYPVSKIYITQYFGENPQDYPRTKGHPGIDFGGKDGDLIFSSADGVVEKLGYEENGYGNYVVIRHNDVYKTIYAHLSSVNRMISINNFIEAGTVIGYMGSTGWSTGTHLHFELRENNKPINPIGYFSAVELKGLVKKKVPALNLRTTPQIRNDNLFATLYADKEFEILEQTQDWVKIKIEEELWVYRNYVEDL